MALHARQIVFNTLDDKSVNIEADYPKDFNILLKQLIKYSKV
jgi:23S rRNA pseudouridine955/2504/2580 synthase